MKTDGPGEAYIDIVSFLKNTKIEYEELKPSLNPPIPPRLRINFPRGRHFEKIVLYDGSNCELFTKLDLVQWVFLEQVAGIWCPKKRRAECELAIFDQIYSAQDRYVQLWNSVTGENLNPTDDFIRVGSLLVETPRSSMLASLGPSSEEFSTLFGAIPGYSRRRAKRNVTLKFNGIDGHSQDEALDSIQRIANNIFFAIDIQTESTFYIPEDIWTNRFQKISSMRDQTVAVRCTPTTYDPEPMQLYWHARRAKTPLLQFLGYYQVLEYYFAAHQSKAAVRRAAHLIKDPLFDPSSENQLLRLVQSVQLGVSGRNLSERDQLETALKDVLEEGDVVRFLEGTRERREFFTKQSKNSRQYKIANRLVNVDDKDADLISMIADRIYNIRCRIVHSKPEGQSQEPLLPFSPLAKNLNCDIDLVRYAAVRIIIEHAKHG